MSDFYVKCPRCKGDRLVFAYTQQATDYTPSRGEYFTCPLCSGTGEAEATAAAEWTSEEVDDD